ncbi:MAG: AAA family ATPase [Betaproteobacteria bacterium]|nr:AAA family ATPase [Betaproteobacteria bacterium]
MERAPELEFIGRQREIDALDAALERAIAGHPGIALLAGEPGIGKTRTAQEIAAHARRRDVLALFARCPEEPGAPPYWPWLQLIRRYVALHDEPALRETIGPAASHIAALDPELAGRLAPGRPMLVEADAAKARFRLFDAIAGFWRRAAAAQPLLLVIDDLHRADVPSLRMIEFVMADAGGSRLMLLGTYRDAEVTRQHPLSDTLAELHRNSSVQRLLLGGFTPAETARFIAAATGAAAPELVSALHDKTAGHPLFLAELAHDLQHAGGTGVARSLIGLIRVPKGVREVIGARLNRLTPLCQQVLQDAAVFGREFRFDLVCRLQDDLPEDAVTAAIDEARRASLIDAQVDPGGYQFAHALVRDTIYDELPARRRAELHRRIGAVLEAQYQGDLTACLSMLAHHYHAAGQAADSGKAIEYATRAAERAAAMQAHEEASRHYLRACAALPEGRATDAQRCRLLLGLGNAQNSAGASTLALATFAEAAECARRVGDASLLAHSAIGFGDAQWRLGSEGSQAVVLIREALAQTARTNARERTALLTALCQALLFSNQPDEAETAFRESVAIARQLGEPLTLFRALCAILPGRWFPDRLALRIEAAREAIAVVQRAGHPEWTAPYLSGWHTGDLMEFGDTVAATTTAQFHLATGETMREPFNQAVALAALSMIAAHEGRFADAEPLAAEALRCGTRFDRANAAGIFGVQMFTIRRHQGRLRELAPVLRHFLDNESPGATWRPGLAILHCELGARDDARGIFERLAVGGFAGIAHDAVRIASLAYLAEVCVWLGDAQRASVLFGLLLPYAGRNIVFGAHTASFGAADRLLGMLATTLQRWDLAQHHLEHAIDFDERTGGRPWLAQSRHALATMLLRRNQVGDRDRARRLLDTALDDARMLGMRGLEEATLDLQRLAAAGRQDAPAPAGLSAREVQVLRLVAAGKTNQEIATALFRSPNTVANHVRNILGKTQTANRAEASAFAVRHGLLPPE